MNRKFCAWKFFIKAFVLEHKVYLIEKKSIVHGKINMFAVVAQNNPTVLDIVVIMCHIYLEPAVKTQKKNRALSHQSKQKTRN